MEQQTTNSQQPASQPNPMSTPASGSWPGAWGIYKHSKTVVKSNWQILLGLILASLVLDWLPSRLFGSFGQLIGFLLSIPPSVALIVAYLAAARGEKMSFGQAFSAGIEPKTYINYMVYLILYSIALFVSFIAFIVPFFFVMPRLSLAAYFLLDKKLDPVEALKASFSATKGNVGKVWGVVGATLAMALLMVTIIGIPFAFYLLFMYGASTVLLYEFITRSSKNAATAIPVAPEPQTPAPQPPAAQ
jgi:hypothetical protein